MHFEFESTLDYLGVTRDFSFSSETELERGCKGQNRILALCKKLGFDEYLNANGGQDLYSREAFSAEGINLEFIQSNIRPYPQGKHEFVSHLSMIDVLMHCDKEKIINMLSAYELV